MKKIVSLIVIIFLSQQLFVFGKGLSMPLLNSGDSCQSGPMLWFFDNDENNKFELFLFGGCPQKSKLFDLLDKSFEEPKNNQKAIFINGSFFNNDFLVYIIDTIYSKYTHKLYYDNQLSKAILEDYSDNCNEPSTYEEADNYFYTKQMGSTLLITKKAEIDVHSVFLCSLDGRIISYFQNVEGWSQFSFDMSLEPSGMYLLRFIARNRALTKRVVYMR